MFFNRKEESSDQFHSSVRPEEIPEIPANKFLFRRGNNELTTENNQPSEPNRSEPQENTERNGRYQRNRDRHEISRSGRKIKGRGMLVRNEILV